MAYKIMTIHFDDSGEGDADTENHILVDEATTFNDLMNDEEDVLILAYFPSLEFGNTVVEVLNRGRLN